MEQFVKELLSKLPESPTELSKKNKKKIYEYLPVPNDYEILWADISSFGGYPAGIVFTDKGVVSKAPRPSIKEKKKQKKNEKVYQIPYQIILWEYFDPSDYICVESEDSSCYILRRDEAVVTVFREKELQEFFEKFERKLRADEDLSNNLVDSTVVSEVETINLEMSAFHAAYGENQSKTGHGVYAEEAGAVLDKINGEKSTVVGRDNAKNGPDKLVEGNPIQCKFCKSAEASVGACFKRSQETGRMEYRYYDIKSGKPMKVEVPADQYDKALEVMRRRIAKGQVSGVSDPDAAIDLVRKSKLTYAQAKNLAKAGTFESITFDAVNGAINCTFAAGISSLVSFGIILWNTNDLKYARDAAIDTAINVFGPSLVANILTNQIARTGLSKALTPVSDKLVMKLGTKTVQRLINARRVLLGQNKIYGAAANRSLSKALRGNAIVECISFIVFSVPDTYRLTTNRISGAQYTKNMLSMGASFTGAIGGTYGAGLAAGHIGEKIGKKMNKKLGAVIGFVAGAGGGILFGTTVKKLVDLFKEDDCIITARLFNAVIVSMAIEYMLCEEEVDKLIDILNKNGKEIRKFQIKIRSAKYQYYEIQQFLEFYFEDVIANRVHISKDDEAEIFTLEESVVVEGVL